MQLNTLIRSATLLFLSFALFLQLAGNVHAADNARAAGYTIVPGHSIGKIFIGQNADELPALLGPAQDGDAAMGKAWSTWYSKPVKNEKTPRQRLDVYSVRNFGHDHDRARVRQIRVTSPIFKTATGLSTHSDFAAIRRAFPHLRAVAYYPLKSTGRVYIYDDTAAGITFEITGPRNAHPITRHCLSILIHPAGRPALDEYIGLHDNLIRLSEKNRKK